MVRMKMLVKVISNMNLKVILLSLVITTSVFADLDKAIGLAEQGKIKEGQLELIKIVKAADAGDAKAQLEFGIMWDEGYWIWQDTALAIEWYEKSANQGFAQAQMILGSVYLGGVKVDKDLNKANKWFDKAIESDSSLAEVVDSLKAWAVEIEQKENKQ